MSIKERTLHLAKYKHLSVNAFEKATGLSSGYLRNTKNYSAEVCAKILEVYPDISPEWLLLGEGEMQREEGYQRLCNNTHSFNSNADEIIKELTAIIKKQEERIRQLTDKLLEL